MSQKQKICMGCFCSFEEDWKFCAKCGWSIDQQESFMDYSMGDVLCKRFLIGKILHKDEEKQFTIWRLFDNVTKINCFGFLKKNLSLDDVVSYKRKIEELYSEKGKIVLLSVQKEKNDIFLVFSFEEKYIDELNYNVLIDKFEIEEPVMVGSENVSEYEQVLSAGTILNEQYEIKECLGIGGFGITYLCKDSVLNRLVAIKEYFPDMWAFREENYVSIKQSKMVQAFRYGMSCFRKEIQITAKFIHTPGVVTLLDAFEENDTIYMVMEFLMGVSIGRELRQKNYSPYSEQEVIDILYPVLDAIEAIHNKGIIHSDISPGNIMRQGNDTYCLIDLGAAKYKKDPKPQMSAAFLKVDYAAPEQYRSAKNGEISDEGEWTDIYALGATLYYLLTGTKATDVVSRLNGTDTDIRESLSDKVSMPWIELIGKMMELEGKERYLSISDVREQVDKLK